MRSTLTTIIAAGAITAAGAGEAMATGPQSGWSGFYTGVHFGFDMPRNKTLGTHVFDGGEGYEGGEGYDGGEGTASFATRSMPTQFTVGGVLGFNYQIGSFIVGLEGDANWINGGYSPDTFIGGDGGTGTVWSKADGLYTIRGRAGILVNDIFIFGTGGAAFSNTTLRWQSATGLDASAHLSSGWTVGGGAETFICPNLSLVVQGLYVDLGHKDVSAYDYESSVELRAYAQQFIWTVGLNYHL